MTADSPLQRARQSLQQTLNWYGSFARHGRRPPSPELQAIAQPYLKRLKGALEQLEQPSLRIALFGLVSRGKSAVINALLGQKRLLTSPLNGETRYPQAVQWQFAGQMVELIDTPGLDEIEGQVRAEMARDVARQADLILFVVAGDITRTEYRALQDLCSAHKPLILVFNKADLYPDLERDQIYQQLRQWASQVESPPASLGGGEISDDPASIPPAPLGKGGNSQSYADLLGNIANAQTSPQTPSQPPAASPPLQRGEGGIPDGQNNVLDQLEDIIMIAAEPAPVLVRHEWPDGTMTEDWETPASAIAPLQDKLSQLVGQAGESLLALNALVQARTATQMLAHKTIEHQQSAAEALIWQYAQGKAIVVAANPIAIADLLGGMISDLALIRNLAKLYGLPMTSFSAERLWRQIIFSSALLLCGEIGGGMALGMAKTAGMAMEGGYPWTTWSLTAVVQGGLAGYGSLVIGRVAQRYLEQGCTWGQQGISPTIRSIIDTTDAPQVMARLRQALQEGGF
ncbi:MAG: GTP-binding protein [Cyanobacteria bacterium P01_G01_bin.54]